MGFDPDGPGLSTYQLESPLFSQVTRNLDPNNYPGIEFIITAPENSTNNMYVSNFALNGKNLEVPIKKHSQITSGGIIECSMTGNTAKLNVKVH